MFKEIRHTGIVVKDLDESLRFYRDLMGFKLVKRMDESGGYLEEILGLQGAKITTLKLALPDQKQMIELIFFKAPSARDHTAQLTDTGITHLALTVDNLDKECKRLKGTGVPFLSGPHISPDRYAKVAFCRAPEGTFIELVEVLAG